MDDISSEVDTYWVVVGVEDEITVLRATYTPERNWPGQSLEVTNEASMGALEKRAEAITIEGMVLKF